MIDKMHYTIKELPVEERPRERMTSLGAEHLSNGELLAILLGNGSREESALRLADKILIKAEKLRFLPGMTLEELQEIKGIGPAKAVSVKAALELGKRLAKALHSASQSINTPQDVAGLVMEEMRYFSKEYFKVLLLNIKNQVISLEDISIGSLNASIVHPREIFNAPVRKSAASVVLIHNHPSGDPAPSREDIQVTKRLWEAGKLLGINVLDHVIIGDGKFLSFQQEGLLEKTD